MKPLRSIVTALVILGLFAGTLAGCKRKERTYAGITVPTPTGTIDPHK